MCDLMTAYNGTEISYDEIGNPLNDGTWTYTWQHGRQLAGMAGSSGIWSFTYDASGMRTRRTNGIHTYNYVYTGGNLVYMTMDTNALRIGYDLNGSPIGLQYNGVLYFYVTNLQGDVIAILNTSGEPVVNYTYDAWGNILSTTGSMASTLGAHNPLRYRGYVYDQETGLYYLQSRYYNPEWGRFINADSLLSTGQGVLGNNMFAYCNNNPVNYIDSKGTFPWLALGIALVCVGVIGIDHMLAANQPEGGYALANESSGSGATTIKGVYAEGNGAELDMNGITLFDLECGLFDITYNSEYATARVLNCFTGNAVAELDWSGIPELNISGVISIYSPSMEVKLPLGLFSVALKAEAHVGAIGGGIELDPDSGRFAITPPMCGVGHSLSIDFDLI